MANHEVGSSSVSKIIALSPNSSDDCNPTMIHEQTKKRPRGRPPSSMNKQKTPTPIITDASLMKIAILEISVDSDIIEAIINFARKSNCGVCVLSARGSVSNVTIHHPMGPPPAVTFRGPFNLLSLSGSFLGYGLTPQNQLPTFFGIIVAGNQGGVYGGIVSGKVVAASTVVVVVATFSKPSVHRIPSKEDVDGGAGQQCHDV